MIKKQIGFCLFLCLLSLPAQASSDGRVQKSPLARAGTTIGRGLLNAVSAPVEFIWQGSFEKKNHPKAWPLTILPRSAYHILVRESSACYDVFIYPFVVPFTDDLSPLTEPMGLPEYPWEWSV